MIIYISDHGDHVGDRRSYGKETFYEKSCKIPLIITGDNIPRNLKIDEAVSIMDIGPTILDFVNAKAMDYVDGVSVNSSLQNKAFNHHPVYAEQIYPEFESYAFMLKAKQYKYITMTSSNSEQLFDTVNDPDELVNLIDVLPDIADKMRTIAQANMKKNQAYKNYEIAANNRKLWVAYEKEAGALYNKENVFYGPVPEKCLIDPEIKSNNSTNL